MLQKRRLTVHPVDAAQFCGYDNGTVVTFLNGIDHLVLDPAATDQDDAQPLPSRLLARTYTGAQLADVAVDTQRECIAEAAVSAAAVVACRVTPLTASQANPSATYSVRAEGPSKIVFFSGCQRLSEVRLGAELAAVDAVDTNACPMQCFRVEPSSTPASLALDVAAFMEGPQTLCACTPQLGKLQTIRFDEQHVCCMGPGRVGRAEVTVVLASGVAVLCGVLNTSPSLDENEEDLMMVSEDQRTTESPSSAATASLSAVARRAFAEANERSNVRILHTVQLPTAPSTTSDVTSAATPCRVAWSGASTLWVLYADGAVVAVQCTGTGSSQSEMLNGAQHNEESQQQQSNAGTGESATETTLAAKHVLRTQLTDGEGQPLSIRRMHIHADSRAPVLHVAFTTAEAAKDLPAQLYYGTARLSESADGSNESSFSVQWRLQGMSYDEQLYGVRFERGQYHILTQSARGRGPLTIAALPRNSAAHSSQTGAAAERACLARVIMTSPESELGDHCRACEDLLSELHLAAQRLASEGDADALLHRLMQAQHALYALLRRQQQSLGVTDLAPSESLPHRLLQRALRLYRQLSAYVLLLRLGVVNTVTRPVRDVLRLDKAAAISQAAQVEWTSLVRDAFRSSSVYQSSVAEVAMWQSSTALCVDALLGQLGLSLADTSCNLTAVLSRMDTLTTEYALFILYYSYHAMGCADDADVIVVPSHSVQEQQRQWRESFLIMFGQSVEVNAWAFVCYAVDHGINPAEQGSDELDASSMRYSLGAAVHHLGVPPFTELLAPVINGLAHVVAVDVLLHMIPTCLAAYTATGAGVPISVSVRLLCVAVRAGSHRMIEALYEVMRATPLLQDLAAQPLAFAALAARDVSVVRGWVEVGSPVAKTVERTLQASENIHQRESVLIAFYILMQRYEDALRVCTSATAADATQAQRLQVVLSYLRSLLSVSSSAWGAEEDIARVTPADVDALLPVDSTVQHPWSQTALAAPLLQTSVAAITEELKRATAAAERGSTQKGAAFSGAASSATAATAGGGQQDLQRSHHHHGGGGIASARPNSKPPVFRPSTLLLSVERGTTSHGTSSPSPGSTVNNVSMR